MKGKITGKTRLLGLFGSPVEHSCSPLIYNYSFQKLGLDYTYLAFDVGQDTLKDAVLAAKTFGMRGFNVTMPCKYEVIPYLDQVSESAKRIRAVNTVVIEQGRLVGYNTDGVGFWQGLLTYGVVPKDKHITVLGGGGGATAIVVQAFLEGAASVSVFVRENDEISRLAREMAPNRIQVFFLEDQDYLKERVLHSQILVQATSVGMGIDNSESLIKDTTMLHKELVVCDIIYSPRETQLLKDAKEAGCKVVVNGLLMLLYQGAHAFSLYTGRQMPVREIQEMFFN